MKFSELWLREWVNPALDSLTLADQITMAGLEVDNIKPVAGAFRGVVVGEIIECNPHPNVANLYVTKVNVGSKRLLNIVCSAQNCCHGIKVAVAMLDAVLPKNLKIKAIKLHGEISEGMLCSFSELSIMSDHIGIIELPTEAPIGADIRNYLKLDDNSIEISITSNRADCFSIIGVARDIAAINNLSLNVPEIMSVPAIINDALPVRVDATDVCPRYLSRIVKGINIKTTTPIWMKEKLRRSDIRSINPVIDVINYVLLELGQPIHAFDLDRIDGGIVVRMAKQGESFIMLGGNEIKLENDTLVIADYYKVLAIGGIFSGAHTGINEYTCNVLLECAWFVPLAIIGRARRYGLHSDTSHRYERGVDPTIQKQAMERVTRLLLDICGGKAGPIVDNSIQEKLPVQATITLRREKMDRLLGYYIDDYNVSSILHRLGCKVSKRDEGKWYVIAPNWRFDIVFEEDLIEEVARIYGYNNIPNVPVKADLIMKRHNETDLSLKRVKTMLVDKGYQEAITYSFVNPKIQSLLHPGKDALILHCPISSEMSVMRLSLWTGLLSTVAFNQHRQQNRVRMFECGLCFVPDKQADLGVRQDTMLACVLSGNCYEEHWDIATRKNVDFYDLKGDLESVLELTGKLNMITFRSEKNPALHPGQSAAIYLQGEHIGYIGMIHPELERKFDLNNRTLVFEVLWDKIASRVFPNVREISRFPANRRDISIVVSETVPVADIIAVCKKVIANQLVSVNLFDIYRGYGINKGFKSLSISLILQDSNRTLEENEIVAIVNNCVAALKELFQATLRD